MPAVETPKTTNPHPALIALADVKVGARHRKDYGDLPALAASMNDVGLLQAIGLNTSHELLWGRRRLKAAEILEWATIPAVVVDCDPADKTLIEYHENVCRKPFTVSEMVEIGKALEKAVGERRGRPSNSSVQDQSEIPRICGELKPGQETADAAAATAGFGSADTYGRAKSIADCQSQLLICLVDNGKVSVAMGAQVAKLDADKQEEFARAVRDGEKPAVAFKSVNPEDGALHVNELVQEWIDAGKLKGAQKDAVLNLGGLNQKAREGKQAQFVRRVLSGSNYADALESVRKGGKRDATASPAPSKTPPAETDDERQEARQRIGEAIGTLIVEFSRLGRLDRVQAMIEQLSAELKAA